MYQVLIDVPNFKQLMRIAPDATKLFVSSLEKLSSDHGCKAVERGAGRWILPFKIQRPSDTAFIMESAFAFYDFLTAHKKQINSFSLVLESVSADEEGERYLRQLLLRTTQDYCLWLGPQAAASLAPYVTQEFQNGLWKALGPNRANQSGNDIRRILLEDYSDLRLITRFIDNVLTKANKGLRICVVSGDSLDAPGDIVNEYIQRKLGERLSRHYVWIMGQHEEDATPIALTRLLFLQSEENIRAVLDPKELEAWDETKNFLFQNSVSPIDGVPPALLHLARASQLFAPAWRLYIRAYARMCRKLDIPFIIHVEQPQTLQEQTLSLLMESICPGEESLCDLLIISTDEASTIPIEAAQFAPVFEIEPLSWEDVADKGISVETLPSFLQHVRHVQSLHRRPAALLSHLILQTSRDGDQQIWDTRIESKLSHRQIERSLITLLLSRSDPIIQDVFFAVTSTYGLLPLPFVFEFLSYLNIEKIRQPVLIQSLVQLGLIRDEELVLPAQDYSIDELERLLGERAALLRSALKEFLYEHLKTREIGLRSDVFMLLSDLADPDQFMYHSFRYGHELLNVGDFEAATKVLDHLSNYLQNVRDREVKQDFSTAIAILNCRSLLLQQRYQELQTAMGHLIQLSHRSGTVLNASLFLQRARISFSQNDMESALHDVKAALIQYQDVQDRTGLAAAQTLFALILISRERLIEARDYLLLARNSATSTNAAYEDIVAGTIDIQTTFIIGYFSRCIEALNDRQGVRQSARTHGLWDHVMALTFLEMRIWFELGFYESAEAALHLAEHIHRQFPMEQAYRTCQTWKARIWAHQGQSDKAISNLVDSPRSVERDVLLAEAYLIANQPREALDLLQKLRDEPGARTINHPELFLWENGFVQLEDRMLGSSQGYTSLSNIAQCLYSLSLAKTGRADEGAEIMARFTRQLKNAYQDPFNCFYYTIYGEILLEHPTNHQDDRTTVLGKAVKFFQERASRIDDPAQKQSFQKSAYWNKQLLTAAKASNLA